MKETNGYNSQNVASVGRLIAYDVPSPNEKLSTFTLRVREQIDALRIGIANCLC